MPAFFPASPELTALLTAALAEDDDTSRLVLADFLDEHDDPRGALIRACCALARSTPADPGWHDASVELHRWQEKHRRDWLGRGKAFSFEGQRGLVTFRVTGKTLAGPRLTNALRSLLAEGWVGKVVVDEAEDSNFQSPLTLERLANVPVLAPSRWSSRRGGKLTSATLASLRGLTQLRELNLAAASLWNLEGTGLAPLADLPLLRRLAVGVSNRSGSGLAHLHQLRSLTLHYGVIVLHGGDLDWPDLKDVASLPNLEHLHIRGHDLLRNLPVLGDAPALTALELSGGLRYEHLDRLGGLTRLRELRMRDISAELPETWPAVLAGFDRLAELTVTSARISPEGAAALADLPKLQRLRLTGGPSLTDAAVALAGVRSLRELSPKESSALTEEGFRSLCRLPNLETLELPGCNALRGPALRHLAALPGLRRLGLPRNDWLGEDGLTHIACLDLVDLDLSSCHNLGDRDLAPLARMTGLKRLSLRYCRQIGNAGLNHLRGLKQLRSLNLREAGRVTVSGVERLRKDLPDCLIDANPPRNRRDRDDPQPEEPGMF
jgi:uncharacterized protein (TIGR02996 family)